MEFVTIAISTFLGAAVALAADRLTKRRDEELKEEAALNSLILDLAAKRAFLAGANWTWLPGEIGRVVGSIEHARTLIRDARRDLRPRSHALPLLREMTRACNTFLETSERADDRGTIEALALLGTKLASHVESLHKLNPRRIYADSPGSFALHTQ